MHPSQIILLSLIALHVFSIQSCMDHEREALLEFKAGITSDPIKRLASWSGSECCNWTGIRCSNQTGLVAVLDLANPFSYLDFDYRNYSMMGNFSPSLLALSNLQYLDLSYNNFYGEVSEVICSFKRLKYLNLSSNYIFEKIPPNLGNLTELLYLDLSNSYTLPSPDMSWLSHLRSLRYLDMSWVNLQDSKNWVEIVNTLPALEVLFLYENKLTYIPQSLPYVNFTSLRALYLIDQELNTTIPSWIFSLQQLTSLVLEDCKFFGSFPVALGNLSLLTELVVSFDPLLGNLPPLHNLTQITYLSFFGIPFSQHIAELYSSFSREIWGRLKTLVLGGCNLQGSLASWIGEMPNLKILDLRYNNLTGPIPVELGNLKNLVELYLSVNSFNGSLTNAHLSGLSKLKVLRIGYTPISLAMENNWEPSFQLQFLDLTSSQVGPKFPTWLQNQVNIDKLYLPDAEIDDVIPNWLWNLGSLSYLDLSNNKLRGKLPESLKNMTKLTDMYLRGNQLEGIVPSNFPNYLEFADLSDNRFQQLPELFQAPSLFIFSLSNNNLSGSIQSPLCNLSSLGSLDFSRNNLSGHLPDCSLPHLLQVNLGNNKLTGTIPKSFCGVSLLWELLVKHNNLTGGFPSSLQFCVDIYMIDLGGNNFFGEVPEWIGNLPKLEFLSLRSNSFSGHISSKLTQLNELRILDLANNHFSGPIPTHLENFTTMSNLNSTTHIYSGDSWSVTMKGIDLDYVSDDYSLSFLRSIDLSNNKLTGIIPESIMALAGLMNLNLSHNHLVGKIPVKIGNMKALESLDLRMNDLSGTIPESMSALSYLGALNVSYNNFSGSIPLGTQLQSFNSSVYMGNPYLCGPPLDTSCGSGGSSLDDDNNSTNSSQKEKLWFYLFIELGFVIGFLVVIFILLFKRSWSFTYFRWVDNKFDKLYVSGVLILKKVRKE